ncbi:MAG TPA: hypothetical protein VLK65_20430 [Vicinamibacteria bacterium]|nr:hypothetical protein [Vicinamibacteria bacterium]
MRGMILSSSLILVAAIVLAEEKTFEGYVTDDMCGAEHMMEGMSDKQCADECVGMGAAYALYVPDDETLYKVDDPEKIKAFAGEDVVVNGTLDEDGETIRIVSVARREQR